MRCVVSEQQIACAALVSSPRHKGKAQTCNSWQKAATHFCRADMSDWFVLVVTPTAAAGRSVQLVWCGSDGGGEAVCLSVGVSRWHSAALFMPFCLMALGVVLLFAFSSPPSTKH